MQKRLKKIGLGLVAVGLSLVLLLTVAIPVCEAGPDEKLINVGHRTSFIGALASSTAPFAEGGLDCVRCYNDYRGGINGIPLKCLWEENHSEGVKDITIHKRFVTAGVVLEYCYTTLGGETTAIMQQRDEVPLLNGAGVTEGQYTDPIPWVFGSLPTWNIAVATLLKRLKAEWAEPRPMRFGMIFYNHPSGFSSKRGIPEYCARNGIEWVGHEVVPLLGAIDVSTELLRLAAKKPDWVYATMYGATLVTTIKDARRLGLREKGIKFSGSPNSVDLVILNTAGARSIEGWYVQRITPSAWEPELFGMKFPQLEMLCKGAKRYRGYEVEEIPEFYVGGWACCLVGLEAIRMAVEKVGIENLTGRAVRDTLASMKNVETGIVMNPINMSDEKPYFVDRLTLYQARGSKIVPVGAPLETVDPAEVGGLRPTS